MIKHPPADDSESTLAAMAYLPGLAPLIYLTLESGKSQFFVRYHVAHAIMLDLASLGAIGVVALLGLVPGAPGFLYLLMGGGLTVVILGTALAHILAGLQAYRKRLVVFPLLTSLYYRITGGR